MCFFTAKGSVAKWLQEHQYHLRSWVRLSMGANFPGFNGIVLLVVDDVPVDNEASVAVLGVNFPGFNRRLRGKEFSRI
jgi:hypothetical protein